MVDGKDFRLADEVRYVQRDLGYVEGENLFIDFRWKVTTRD